jgi:hypothetical protein
MAKKYFSRLRRAEIGIHPHIAGSYLLRYTQEPSRREDNCRISNGDQMRSNGDRMSGLRAGLEGLQEVDRNYDSTRPGKSVI